MQKGGAGERTHVVMKLAAARRLYSDFSVSEELSFDDLLLAAGDLNLLVRQGNKLAFIRQPDQEYLAAQAWAFEHRAYDLVVPPWTPETSSLERVVSGLLEDERLPSPPSTGWEETVLMGAEMADDDAVVDGLLAVNASLAGRVASLRCEKKLRIFASSSVVTRSWLMPTHATMCLIGSLLEMQRRKFSPSLSRPPTAQAFRSLNRQLHSRRYPRRITGGLKLL
ncbi:MAG: hypothetical protein AAFU66_05230 [Pseudomonadota bacterium]